MGSLTEMPAKSKKHQMAAGAALAAKRGEGKVSELESASKEMYESMSEDELDRMASVKRDKLPDEAKEKSQKKSAKKQ